MTRKKITMTNNSKKKSTTHQPTGAASQKRNKAKGLYVQTGAKGGCPCSQSDVTPE